MKKLDALRRFVSGKTLESRRLFGEDVLVLAQVRVAVRVFNEFVLVPMSALYARQPIVELARTSDGSRQSTVAL